MTSNKRIKANDATEDEQQLEPLFSGWTFITSRFHDMIHNCCIYLSHKAATNPKLCVVFISIWSLVVLGLGLSTNFSLQVDYETVYAPFGSASTSQWNWIDNGFTMPHQDNHDDNNNQQYQSFKFPARPHQFLLLIHANGGTVLTKTAMERTFMALEEVRTFENYNEICSQQQYPDNNVLNDTLLPPDYSCSIVGPTRFWNNNETLFYETVETDADVVHALSAETFPDEMPTTYDFILGNYQTVPNKDNPPATDVGVERNKNLLGIPYQDVTLTHAEVIYQSIFLPAAPDLEGRMSIEAYEERLLEHMWKVKNDWKDDPNNEIQLELFTWQSYQLEFKRAIVEDIKLVFVVALVMTTYTCMVFLKRDAVNSRTWLGVGSITCITLSLMTAYGLLFVVGIGFTNMTVLLPFVMYGVGLDDTFIITETYFRTDPEKHAVVRIQETMHEVASSIFLTTFTTTLAFAVGCFSIIPSIRWLCIYACISVNIVFLYQVTFFVAVLILDERRISDERNDLVFSLCKQKDTSCIATEDGSTDFHFGNNDEPSEEDPEDMIMESGLSHRKEGLKASVVAHHWMDGYCKWLLQKYTRLGVLSLFVGYFSLCVWRTTKMRQEFNSADFVPGDSYIKDFLNVLDDYSEPIIELGVYFRDVDQMNLTIQREMKNYLNDLAALEQIDGQPPFCWVTDFLEAQEHPDYPLKGLDFRTQIDVALQVPVIHELYGNDIVRNNESDIVASRCWMYMKGLDLGVVEEQIEMLQAQRAVSDKQAMNDGLTFGSSHFFTFTEMNFIWEFYAVTVEELIYSTVGSVAAVCVAALSLIPHWSAVPFLLPLIVMLYFDLIGTLEILGVHINVVTYVCLVISIGLLVDFVAHILLRYYKCRGATREEKVRETLRTMGASISMGGMSTLLAVIPLAFSVSKLVGTVFYCFFAMIAIGVVHGLVFLPVLLSIVGPLRIPETRRELKEIEMPEDESDLPKVQPPTTPKTPTPPTPPQKDIPLEDLLYVYEFKRESHVGDDELQNPKEPHHR